MSIISFLDETVCTRKLDYVLLKTGSRMRQRIKARKLRLFVVVFSLLLLTLFELHCKIFSLVSFIDGKLTNWFFPFLHFPIVPLLSFFCYLPYLLVNIENREIPKNCRGHKLDITSQAPPETEGDCF